MAHREVTLSSADVARGAEWSLEDGFFRLVVAPETDVILGATFVGYEAGELIHVILAHMEAGSSWRVLDARSTSTPPSPKGCRPWLGCCCDRSGPIADVVRGREGDPFAVLGPHALGTGTVVRAFFPGAHEVTVVDPDGKPLAPATPADDGGLFEALVVGMTPRYLLRVEDANGVRTIEDPYRFGPLLGELDAWLLAEGNHLELHRVLGAHPETIDGVPGTRFAVWAPNARRVSVVGDWNAWDGRVHPMRLRREAGVWELFLPGVEPGARYKYELLGPRGELLPLRADPVAFRSEVRPGNASVVAAASSYVWRDAAWLEARGAKQRRDAPIQIYEVHLGSWRRVPEQGDRFLTYRELAEQLIPYVVELGFTHIELLPITEHPYDLSWGYQTTGWFAPTSRFGERRRFPRVHRCGARGRNRGHPRLGARSLPTEAHALGRFDGTPLYEHADPREGYHAEWGTYVFNLARNEVANFLIASALYWLREFHLDGLRVDAVASAPATAYPAPTPTRCAAASPATPATPTRPAASPPNPHPARPAASPTRRLPTRPAASQPLAPPMARRHPTGPRRRSR